MALWTLLTSPSQRGLAPKTWHAKQHIKVWISLCFHATCTLKELLLTVIFQSVHAGCEVIPSEYIYNVIFSPSKVQNWILEFSRS